MLEEFQNMEKLRPCPVCHASSEKAGLFVGKNIDPNKLSKFSFSSRKEPEYMCHRLVQCPNCDLVYADEPPDEQELADAYHTADYDSSEEADDAARAYIRVLQPALSKMARRRSALEIGAGTGTFLEHLLQEGFTDLVGIEPSSAAIASAPVHRLAWMREGMFEEKNFVPESFDLVCCFMTLEHVRDPDVVAQAAFRLLRPGGAFVAVTHDYRSIVNRLLGKRSPIIDIEHLQLFSERSVRYLFEGAGYTDVTVKTFINTYSLRYWMRLAPLPGSMKSVVLNLMAFIGLDNVKIGINVGNIVTAGIKRG
ncbi:MAG: class I SAM-dependent methyltransferase [Methylococcaceae bacterium]